MAVVSSSHEDDGEPQSAERVITAAQFNRAAAASGRTMLELAELIGVTRGMMYTYRRQGVLSPPRRVEQVRRVMAMWLRDDDDNPLDGYSDQDLVRELGRRVADLHAMLDQTASDDGNEPITMKDAAVGGGGGRYTGTGGPPDA